MDRQTWIKFFVIPAVRLTPVLYAGRFIREAALELDQGAGKLAYGSLREEPVFFICSIDNSTIAAIIRLSAVGPGGA